MLAQPTLASAGTPQRVSINDIWVRSFLVQGAAGNTGDMYLSDSESNASTTNRVALCPGSILHFNADNWGATDSMINLKDLWFDGATTGDKLVVMYLQDKDKRFGGLQEA